jgi:hypothetical protein
VADIHINGQVIDLKYKSPLAQQQMRQDAQNTLLWLERVLSMGPQAASVVDQGATVKWLGRMFGVPSKLIREASATPNVEEMAAAAATLVDDPGVMDKLTAVAGNFLSPPQKEAENA